MEKPILFNTEMVRSILEGRKTETRRVCKITVNGGEKVAHKHLRSFEENANCYKGKCTHFFDENEFYEGSAMMPYQIGDIMYVRETWRPKSAWSGSSYGCEIEYKAGGTKQFDTVIAVPKYQEPWHPSIHMPKSAARLFLEVTNIRVERLQDISSAEKEGLDSIGEFRRVWDSTLKPDSPFVWSENPFVWVIEFSPQKA